MIDRYDISLFRRFLHLARTQGTDVIKVVVGDEPDTWIVKVFREPLQTGRDCGGENNEG